MNTVSLEPAGSGGVSLEESNRFGGIKPRITSDSSLVRSCLLMRWEFRDYFLTFGIKTQISLHSDCSSNSQS